MKKNIENLGKYYKPWDQKLIDQCISLYKKGISKNKICPMLNVSEKSVKKYLALNGIGIRPRGFYLGGKNNPSWKGGKTVDKSGYILVYSPNHPYRDNHNYVREHRLVMEKIIGRYLLPEEVVHHINNVNDDNRPENLEVMTQSKHAKNHAKGGRDKATGKFKTREVHDGK